MKIFSQVISWVFLPLFMPIYGLLLTFYIPSNQDYHFNEDNLFFLRDENKIALLSLYFLLSALMPAISMLVLRVSGNISTIEMDDRRERSMPIVIMFSYCLLLYGVLWWKTQNTMPSFIYALPMAGSLLTGIVFFLNKWRKVSIHAAGSGILVGFLLAYFLEQVEFEPWIFTVSILVSGLVMTARVYLRKHTLLEVVVGWLTGTLITFATCLLY